MRFLNFFAFFVVSWGCARAQEVTGIATTNLTEGSLIIEDVKIPGAVSVTEQIPLPSSTEKVEQNKNATADSLIDRIIDLAIKHIKEKTTGAIKLSDEVKEFNRKFLVFPIKGEMVLYNGELNGINTIKRSGDASYEIHGTEIDVNTTFQFEELDFIYDFQANIYKLSTDGVCKGNITKLVTDVGLKIKIKEKEITLTRLKLIAAKTLRIQLDSTKFRDKVINYVLKTVTSIFKTALLTQMEKELHEYVGTSIHYSYTNATVH